MAQPYIACYVAVLDAGDVESYTILWLGNAVQMFVTVVAPECFGCRGTARAPEIRLGHLQKLCVSFLFLVEASTHTVRMNGSKHGRKNSIV